MAGCRMYRSEEFVMETFALGPRAAFARAFGQNPLVRFSDRVETIAVLLAVAISLIGIPFAAAFGTSVHEQRAHAYAQQTRDLHQLAAVATANSTIVPRGYSVEIRVPVTWHVQGTTRTDVITVADPVRTGQDVTIWLDRDGGLARPPAPPTRAGIEAVGAALAVWLGLSAVCTLVVVFIRARLDRARAKAWDHDLRSLSGDGGRSAR